MMNAPVDEQIGHWSVVSTSVINDKVIIYELQFYLFNVLLLVAYFATTPSLLS